MRAALHCEVTEREWDCEHIDRFIERCEQFFSETIASGEYVAWVAEEDGAIIGGGGALFRRALPSISLNDAAEVKIQSMYVVPEKRNAGIGAKLLGEIMEYLRERKIERVLLGPSQRAHGFYRAFGFVDVPYMRLQTP